MNYPPISAWPARAGNTPAIIIARGHLVSVKVRLDEAHALADQLVDLAEQLTEKGEADGTTTMR